MNRTNRVNRRELKGRRIAVLATDGFEKVELTIPVAALKYMGAKVDIISLRRGRIRGVNLHEPAGRVRVNKTVREANPSDYDALLLPGGFINPDLLRQSAEAREFVRRFDRAQKPIASLCHGPWVLASAGLLENRVLTSWPGIRDDVVNAGATWLNEPFVEDGNLVTSRGPHDLVPFIRGIARHFAKGASMRRRSRISQSSPQAAQPPGAVIGAMKWLPKPSTRAVLFLGALAAGLVTAGTQGAFEKMQRRLRRAA
ncbi:MAG TPA: type 1 glutamine amidotransferase domain-containing protein [Terriglobales bacterium]|nr:type 1 glutamine amidotransferase domain-containing protein [Terriglobales bacterium]